MTLSEARGNQSPLCCACALVEGAIFLSSSSTKISRTSVASFCLVFVTLPGTYTAQPPEEPTILTIILVTFTMTSSYEISSQGTCCHPSPRRSSQEDEEMAADAEDDEGSTMAPPPCGHIRSTLRCVRGSLAAGILLRVAERRPLPHGDRAGDFTAFLFG